MWKPSFPAIFTRYLKYLRQNRDIDRLLLLNLLVCANTGSFQSLGAQLLVLVGDHVDAKREVINAGALATKVEDTNLRIGNTTVEARLGVRLSWTVSVIASLCCKGRAGSRGFFTTAAR